MMFEQQTKGKVENFATDTLAVKWLAGKYSCTLVIQKDFCADYGLDFPSQVVVEKRDEGLLIRKMVV